MSLTLNKIYEFDPVIYPYGIWIVIDNNPNLIPDLFDEYSGKPIESIDRDTKGLEAFTMPVIRKENPKFGVVIFFRSKESMTFELAAHESSHAAKYLFEHIGANVAAHETFEFLVGWIASCIGEIKSGNIIIL